MKSILRKTSEWLDLSRVISCVYQETICEFLGSSFSELKDVLGPHKVFYIFSLFNANLTQSL
jgi:hypothetical protein